jgi:hypothetical protein
MPETHLIEWTGAGLGVLGSLMISFNRRMSRYAWIPWIASNLLLMLFAWGIAAWGIFAMQAVFLAINVNGLTRWLLRPPRHVDGSAPPP